MICIKSHLHRNQWLAFEERRNYFFLNGFNEECAHHCFILLKENSKVENMALNGMLFYWISLNLFRIFYLYHSMNKRYNTNNSDIHMQRNGRKIHQCLNIDIQSAYNGFNVWGEDEEVKIKSNDRNLDEKWNGKTVVFFPFAYFFSICYTIACTPSQNVFIAIYLTGYCENIQFWNIFVFARMQNNVWMSNDNHTHNVRLPSPMSSFVCVHKSSLQSNESLDHTGSCVCVNSLVNIIYFSVAIGFRRNEKIFFFLFTLPSFIRHPHWIYNRETFFSITRCCWIDCWVNEMHWSICYCFRLIKIRIGIRFSFCVFCRCKHSS